VKNIAIIVPTLNKGGAERVAANLSLEFAKYYNVYVIVHDGRDVTYPYGGTLIDLQLPPASSKLGKVLTLLKRVRKLRRIKKEKNIHVSISHLDPSDYVNLLSRRKDRVFLYRHNKLVHPVLEKWIARWADKLICVSRFVEEHIVREHGVPAEKAVTVYNFCDIDAPEPREKGPALTVMNMGRLSREKGQWHLLRAMKLVRQQLGDRVRLKILGDGEYRQTLETLADRLGLGDAVTFGGFCQDPWSQLVEGDIFAFTSLWEGLPMALVEAGRCGLPILSTDCDSGCREILAPDTPPAAKTRRIEYGAYGILAPVFTEGEPDRLEPTEEEKLYAQALIELCEDPALRQRYSVLARERSEDFRSEKIMGQWRQLIGEP